MLMEAISQGEILLSNWASSPSLSYGQSGVSPVLWNPPSWVLRVYAPSIIPWNLRNTVTVTCCIPSHPQPGCWLEAEHETRLPLYSPESHSQGCQGCPHLTHGRELAMGHPQRHVTREDHLERGYPNRRVDPQEPGPGDKWDENVSLTQQW